MKLLQQVLFTAEQSLAWLLNVPLLPLFPCTVFANLRTYFLNNFLELPSTDPITTKHVICLRIKNISFDYLLSYQSQGKSPTCRMKAGESLSSNPSLHAITDAHLPMRLTH